MNNAAADYFYPNRMLRMILQAMEENIGRNGVNAILNLACLPEYIQSFPPPNQELVVPFDHISRLQSGLEHAYGSRGGHGLALRTGRTCFTYSLREFGPELGLADQAFRLLPLREKIRTSCEALASLFNRYTDQRVHLETDSQYLRWQIERCPLCWGRQTDSPCCHLAVGFLQEALFWVSGGKYFFIEEIGCIARGDHTCTILIEKVPLA